jgi:2-polyprenyl-3-methyl-5-hydroxy-6-metoxy-1,4-benzoquinol methylase
MELSCNICGGECVELFKLYDDRYGYPGKFPLLKCRSCGHGRLQGEFSEELLKRLYTDYYPRSTFDVEKHTPRKEERGFWAWLEGKHRSAFRYVPENVRVLDIGCGLGESLGYYRLRGCDAYGVEADENVRRVAEEYGYKVHVGIFEPEMYEPGFFDYITMDQVIEHVTDPVSTLRGISRVLKPGGIAVLSTPNANGWGAKIFGRRWINWHAPYHLQHFSLRSMRICAEKAGLVIDNNRTITSSAWLHYQWSHLCTRPGMGKPSGFWSSRGKLSTAEKLSLYALNWIHRTKINHLITRTFDSLGLGDNFVFLLRKPA